MQSVTEHGVWPKRKKSGRVSNKLETVYIIKFNFSLSVRF